jgi:hypothetical protein
VSDEETEDLPELDLADPLKRDPDDEEEEMPGLDPVLTTPPE